MRFLRFSLVVAVTVALLLSGLRLVTPGASAQALATARAAVQAAAAAANCSPNSSDTSTVAASRCIAERQRTTRSHMNPACPTDSRALVRGALYGANDCQAGSGQRIEAIAHMRAVAQLNARGLNGRAVPAGGISPDLQWEINTTGNFRADLLVYDRLDPSGTIGVGEVKSQGTSTSRVSTQLRGYLNELKGGPNARAATEYSFAGYSDYFRVWNRKCSDPGARYQVIDRYDVYPDAGASGILRFRKLAPEQVPCSSNPTPPPTVQDDEDAHEDEDHHEFCENGCVVPAPGTDNDEDGKDDFFEDFLDGHPELIDLPEWPTIPAPSSQTVAVAAGAALAIAAGIAICAATAPACGTFLTALAGGGAVGSISAEAAIAALLLVLATLSLGYVHGEPHFVTMDGASYPLQAVGEFHLLRLPEEGIDVQTRLVPLRGMRTVSTVGPVSTTVGDEVVELREDAALVNGEAVGLAPKSMMRLGDDGSLLIRKADGDYAVVDLGRDRPFAMERTWRTVEFVLPDGVPTEGLLGNHDGNRRNDLALPDGTPAPSSGQTAWLHGTYADAWRIDGDESLFTYAAGESTETFTDRTFPDDILTLGDLSSAVVAAASEKCTAAGVLPGPQFDACVFDIGVTGDDAFAAGAALLDEVLETDGERPFAADGTLVEDFETQVSPNFRAAQYSQDPATGRFAGPLFDTPAYRISKGGLPRHDALSVGFDLYAFGPTVSDSVEQSLTLRWGDGKTSVLDLDTATPAVSGTRPVTVTVAGTGALADGTAFRKYRVAADLGGASSDLTMEVVPTNFRGVLGTGFGVDNLRLAVDAPPADAFDVDLPLTVPGPAGSGLETADGAGRLETNGSLDSYAFDLAEPASLLLQPSSCDVSTTFTVVRVADGKTVHTGTCSRHAVLPDLGAGGYRLDVTAAANAGHGDYEVKLMEVPDPQTFGYVLGSTVSNGNPAPGAGNLETPVSVDRYEFDVPSGGRSVYYERTSGSKRANLVDATGKVVANLGYGGVQVTLAEGSYAVELPAQSAGTYGFRLFEVPPAQEFPYTVGTTVSNGVPAAGAGNLETPASVDRYPFTVPASGVRVQYERLSGAKKVRILDATGAVVAERTNYTNFQVDLPAGDYTVEFPAQSAGTYSFRLFAIPDAQSFAYAVGSTVSNGVPAAGAGNLETVASIDRYPFSVPVGGLKLQYERLSGAKKLRILDATGAVVVENTNYTNFQVTLPQGEYTVEFLAQSAGTYSFRLFEVPPPQSFAYTLGSTVSNGVPAAGAGNLETVASIDRYPFSVPAGGLKLQYERTSGAKKVRILDATGAVVVSNTNYTNFQVTLAEGDYTVEFPAGDSGTYGFRLFEVPPPQSFAYTLGSTVSNGVPAAGAGNLETVASIDRYPFSVPAGGLKLQYERTSGAKKVRILDATGAVVVSNTNYTNFQVTLAEGDYTVEFPAGDSGTYGFRLFEVPPPQSFAYTLGSTVSNGVPAAGAGNLETVASIDRYPFSVPAGGLKLQYERTSGAKKLRILDAAGTVVLSNTNYTNFQVTLAQGDYTVEFPAGDSGTYGFRLSALP